MAFQLFFLFAIVANVLVAGQIPDGDSDIELSLTLGQLERLARHEPGRALVSIYNAGEHVRDFAKTEQVTIQEQIEALRSETSCSEGLIAFENNEMGALRKWNSQNYTTEMIHTPRMVEAKKNFDTSAKFAKATLNKCPIACWNFLSLGAEVKSKMIETRTFFRKALQTSINLVEEQIAKDADQAQAAFYEVKKKCLKGDNTGDVDQRPSQEPTNDADQQPSQEPTNDADQKPSQEPTNDTDQKPSQEPTNDADQQPSQEPTNDADQKPSQEPINDADQQPSEEPTNEESNTAE